MEKQFYDKELLYRGVLPIDGFWKEDGTISSAVFKTRPGEDGISVDRQADRSPKEALLFAISHLKGAMVTITVQDVHDCGAEVIASPIIGGEEKPNEFHSILVRNRESGKLTSGQSKHLSRVAHIVYRPE